MKNNELNKNILRAISIGLAATITLMPTVTAFADDDTEKSSNETSSNESHDKASDASDSCESSSSHADDYDDHRDDERDHEEDHEEEHHDDGGDDSSSSSESESSNPEPSGNTEPTEDTSSSEGSTEDTYVYSDLGESISTEMAAAGSAMGDIADIAENYNIEALNKEANDAINAVDSKELGTTNMVDYAAALIGNEQTEDTFAAAAASAVQMSGDTLNQVNADVALIQDAASQSYSSESEAKSAQATAAAKIIDAELNLADSKAAEDTAKEKYDEATTALDGAREALGNANTAKDNAETAVNTARDNYKKALDEYGINYGVDNTTGKIIIKENIKDGLTDKAVTNAAKALEDAEAELTRATNKQSEAYTAAVTAVTNKNTVAQQNKTDAENAYNSFSDTFNGVTEEEKAEKTALHNALDGMLAKDGVLAAARNDVEEVKSQWISGQVGGNDYWAANRELAKSLTEYILIQDGIAQIGGKVTIDNNKNVTFTNAEGKQQTITIDYKALNADGKKVEGSEIVKNNEVNVDTLNSIVQIRVTFKLNGQSYEKTEKGIVEGTEDQYQKDKAKLGRLAAAKEVALQEAKDTQSIVDQIANDANLTLEEVSAKAQSASLECKAAKTAWEENLNKQEYAGKSYDNKENTLNQLINDIETEQTKVQEAGYTMAAYRELAALMAKYSLIQRSDVDPDSVIIEKESPKDPNSAVKWCDKNGDKNHYGEITYTTTDGETHTAYYDYLAYFDNGVRNNFDSTAATLKNQGVKEDHIDVVLKEKDEALSNPNKYIFKSKGTSCINESDFIKKTDSYQKYKELYDKLIYAQTIETLEYSIVASKEAETLRNEVSKAKDKVDAAAAALKSALDLQTLNTSWIDTLTTKFNEAEKVYNTAKEKYEQAVKNTKAITEAIKEMKAVAGNITYTAPTIAPGNGEENGGGGNSGSGSRSGGGSGSGSSGGGSAEEGGGSTVTETPAVESGVFTDTYTAPAAETPAAEIPAPAETTVFTPADTAFAAPGEEAAPAEAVFTAAPGVESAVLGDTAAPETTEAGAAVTDGDTAADENLTSDVLGERMAPIVNAVNDGTFTRDMLFTDEAKKIPFPWWILFFVLGATGVTIYVKTRKKRS